MTRLFGGTASIQATGRFLRRQLWSWPIIAAIVLGGAGFWVNQSVQSAMRHNRIESLFTILNADIEALTEWIASQRKFAELVCRDEKLAPMVRDLLDVAKSKTDAAGDLIHAESQAAIRTRLINRIKLGGYTGFFLVAPNGMVIAADQDAPVGKSLDGYRKEFFELVIKGTSAVSKPFRSPLLLPDEKGELKSNLPSMFAAADIKDDSGTMIAALGLRIRPEDQFTRILAIARSGDTGETYAFNEDGLMLSESRFDDQLKATGLLADLPESKSSLTLELRDPGVNMVAGERPKLPRAQQVLSTMVQSALEQKVGSNGDGYRDYRGVPVVGAWKWLEALDFGVATKIDVTEAFKPLVPLQFAFAILMALLFLCAVGIFFAMLHMSRQQLALMQATLHAKKLGQYTLEEKLGEGGMGTVYRARHAMLKRPTAIKLLNVDRVSDAAIGRFEREVQMTGGLSHPNTVAIFDYGRTPEGIFYYAMEYLEGINLDDLIARHGPLPEARLVYILKQVCGSLAEAHAAGLVHRDIKPANIFLTTRGGMHDFVKVLDFGLVKALGGDEQSKLTSTDAVTGTPLYLAPETVTTPELVDARTDVYALGAVAYYLHTGGPVFLGRTVMEICMKHVQTPPDPPSAKRPISSELEALILRCLAKSQADRPADAGELLQALDRIAMTGRWSADDAKSWWESNRTDTSPELVAAPHNERNKDTAPPSNLELTAAY